MNNCKSVVMVKHTIVLVFLFSLSAVQESFSQDVITPEEAVQLGLERNFGILIAKNEYEIDRMNRTLGNAGFLPSLQATGTRAEIFESESATENGTSLGSEDIEISDLSMDVELDWTIFDGFRMFTTYRKLGELEKLGEALARLQIENTIAAIIEAYFEIVRQEKLLSVLHNSVEISEERYEIARTKRELGSGSEYEVLLARSDLNADRAEVIRQEVTLNDRKLALIRLLDLDSNSEFDVIDRIEISEELFLDDLYPGFLENNREMEASSIRTSVSELEIREIRRERLPQLDLNAGYSFNREETRNTLLLMNRTDGFYVGVTARINLFDGFNTNRRVQTAKIVNRNEQIRMEEQFKLLETTLFSEHKNYVNAIQLVELENENLTLANSALDIALEQFRLATITSVELRETQRILFDTENRLIDAQFEAKLAETELLRLSGRLDTAISETE